MDQIIKEQQNKLIELPNRNRLLKLELTSIKSELQANSFSLDSMPDDKVNFYTGFVSRNILNTVWNWMEPAARTITLYDKSNQSGSDDVSSQPSKRKLKRFGDFF